MLLVQGSNLPPKLYASRELKTKIMEWKLGSLVCYLLGHESDHIGQLLDDQINALEAGLLQPSNLFLDNGLEGHVRSE